MATGWSGPLNCELQSRWSMLQAMGGAYELGGSVSPSIPSESHTMWLRIFSPSQQTVSEAERIPVQLCARTGCLEVVAGLESLTPTAVSGYLQPVRLRPHLRYSTNDYSSCAPLLVWLPNHFFGLSPHGMPSAR